MICLAKDDKSFVAKEKSNSTKYEIVISLEKWKHFIEFSNRNHLVIIFNAQCITQNRLDCWRENNYIFSISHWLRSDNAMSPNSIRYIVRNNEEIYGYRSLNATEI